MLKVETIQKLAKIAKIDPKTLETAIKDSEEKDVDISDALTVLDDKELETLKKNEYKAGKEKGLEMTIKEVKDKHNLEFTGKSLDDLLEAHKAKALADAKLKPDEKVAELETKLKTAQATATELQAKLTEKETEVGTIRTNSELFKYIPEISNENGPSFDREEIMTMMKAKGYDFKMENGALVAMKDGNPVTDKIGNGVPVKDVITGYLKERKLINEAPGTPGGRGGSSSGAAFKPGKLSEIKAKFESEGKSFLGGDFSQAVAAAVKDNPDFDMAG